MAFDLSNLTRNFYQLITDKETISYYRGDMDSFDSGITIANVKRRAVEKGLIGADLNNIYVYFHLFEAVIAALFDPFVPKRGDKITDSNDEDWIVESVEVQSIQNRYRCLCYLAHGSVYERQGDLDQ